jgi:hypothetical protein
MSDDDLTRPKTRWGLKCSKCGNWFFVGDQSVVSRLPEVFPWTHRGSCNYQGTYPKDSIRTQEGRLLR